MKSKASPQCSQSRIKKTVVKLAGLYLSRRISLAEILMITGLSRNISSQIQSGHHTPRWGMKTTMNECLLHQHTQGNQPETKKMIVEVIRKIGLRTICGGTSSLSSEGGIVNDKGDDSFSSFNCAVPAKIALNDNVTSCLNKITQKTKQQTNALMMQFLDCQAQTRKCRSGNSMRCISLKASSACKNRISCQCDFLP